MCKGSQHVYSLEVLRAELLLQEPEELLPARGVLEELLQGEGPPAHATRRDVLPARTQQQQHSNCTLT